jgi:hypothetical protein
VHDGNVINCHNDFYNTSPQCRPINFNNISFFTPFASHFDDVDDDNANDIELSLLLLIMLLMLLTLPLVTPPKKIILSAKKRLRPCSCRQYRSNLLNSDSNYAILSHLVIAVV